MDTPWLNVQPPSQRSRQKPLWPKIAAFLVPTLYFILPATMNLLDAGLDVPLPDMQSKLAGWAIRRFA